MTKTGGREQRVDACLAARYARGDEGELTTLFLVGLRALCNRGSIELTGPSAPRIDRRDAVPRVLVEVLGAFSRLTAEGLEQALEAALSASTGEEARALAFLRPPSNRRDGRGAP